MYSVMESVGSLALGMAANPELAPAENSDMAALPTYLAVMVSRQLAVKLT